jgi:hypothetical protein
LIGAATGDVVIAPITVRFAGNPATDVAFAAWVTNS